jgi:hypothetical protein
MRCGLLGLTLLTTSAFAQLTDIYAVSESFKINKEGTRVWSLQDFNLPDLKKKNHVWDGQKKLVSVSGAKGEIVSFQLILGADEGGAAEVNVSVTDLQGPGTIAAKQVELFKTWYVKTTRPSAPQNAPSTGNGWYPDALVPWEVKDVPQYDGPPFAIEKNMTQAVWVEVEIPRDAVSGEHRGKINVTAGGKTTTLDLALRVFNFALPRETHNLLLINGSPNDIWEAGGYWLGKDTARKLQYEDELYRMARRHRFTFGNMYYESLWGAEAHHPKLTLDAEGNIKSVDWTAYDARWDRVLNPKKNVYGEGEPPIEYWRLPFVTGIKVHKKFPATDKLWSQLAKEVKKHWAEKGWDLSRTYIYLVDEPNEKQLLEVLPFTKALKEGTTPALPTQIAFLPQPAGQTKEYYQTAYAKLAGQVDRWLWSANSIDCKTMREKLKPDVWKGFYQGNGPYAGAQVLDKDGLEMRTWAWIAWMYRMDFSCYYECTGYISEQEGNKVKMDPNEIWFNPGTRPNGNQSKGIYIYPGNLLHYDKPIVNMRMKQMRRGQQDYEYMWLLAQKTKREDIDAGVRAIIVKALEDAEGEKGSKGHWSTDPEKWDEQVRKWGEAIEKASP